MFAISDNVLLYSFAALFCKKTVLLAQKSFALKFFIRSEGNYFFNITDNFFDIKGIVENKKIGRNFSDFREENFKKIKNILILKTGGLGDLILSYPSISLIRKAYPNSKITALVIPYMLQLVKYNKDIDEVIVYDKQKKKDFKYIFSLGTELREKKFDVFFLLNRSPRAVLLAYLSGAKNIIGYKTPFLNFFITHRIYEKDRKRYKVILQNMDVVRGIGIDEFDISYPDYSFEKSERIEKFFKEKMTNFSTEKSILINIGGRWPSKKFKQKKWSLLIDALIKKYNIPVFLLWGPDERDIVDNVYNDVSEKNKVFILPSTNMGEVAVCLSKCSFSITCDTGAMHIADAMKIPQIVLMGPTSPVRWGPISPKSLIIYNKMSCGPCNIENCPYGHNLCMAKIKPQDILLKINELGTFNF